MTSLSARALEEMSVCASEWESECKAKVCVCVCVCVCVSPPLGGLCVHFSSQRVPSASTESLKHSVHALLHNIRTERIER